jgi:RND family efflux transporter MFP subunit
MTKTVLTMTKPKDLPVGWRRLWHGALLATAVLAAITACSPPPPPPALPPPRVTVAHPQTMTVTNWDEYPGHVEAVEMVEIRPRVSGYLESIHFADGAEVKAGELLFVIDPKPYQAELDRATAGRRQAETSLDLARNELQRVEGLRGTKAISEEEYDTRSKAVRQREALLAGAQAAEAAARLNLEYTRIKAPISGKIGRRLVTAGNLVQLQGVGGATVLATLVSLDPMYCYFDVEESAFLKYHRHTNPTEGTVRAQSPLQCQLGLANEAGFPHQGEVDFSDNQVDRRIGTLRMRARFANQDRALVPGLFARVRVPAGPPATTLLIPDLAVQSDQDRKFVFVVNATNVVEARPVSLERAHGHLRSVRSGLTTNDQVAVSGLLMLRPGVRVDVQTGSPGGAEAAGAPAAR